jgi:hypothetical protein
MQIVTDDYHVYYFPEQSRVILGGIMRLDGLNSYQPILQLLLRAIESVPQEFTLDVQNLQFLNSSGLSMLLMFVVRLREQGRTHLTILGSQSVSWQVKSLKNVRRLMPDMKLLLLPVS